MGRQAAVAAGGRRRWVGIRACHRDASGATVVPAVLCGAPARPACFIIHCCYHVASRPRLEKKKAIGNREKTRETPCSPFDKTRRVLSLHGAPPENAARVARSESDPALHIRCSSSQPSLALRQQNQSPKVKQKKAHGLAGHNTSAPSTCASPNPPSLVPASRLTGARVCPRRLVLGSPVIPPLPARIPSSQRQAAGLLRDCCSRNLARSAASIRAERTSTNPSGPIADLNTGANSRAAAAAAAAAVGS